MEKYLVIAKMYEGKQKTGWCVMSIKTGACIVVSNTEAYKLACDSRLVNASGTWGNIRGDGVRLTDLPILRAKPNGGLQLNVNQEVISRVRLIEQTWNLLARLQPSPECCVFGCLGSGNIVRYSAVEHKYLTDKRCAYTEVAGNLANLAGGLTVYTGEWLVADSDRMKRLLGYLATLGHSPGVRASTEIWQDKRLIEQQQVELT